MHKAKNCIITCIDFRIQNDYHDWIKTHEMLSNSDIISVAGCSRDLAKPLKPEDKEFLVAEIRSSIELHKPENIVILDHQDCGKYAVDQCIPEGMTKAADLESHRTWSKLARDVLHKEFPQENISTYYFDLDGKVDKI